MTNSGMKMRFCAGDDASLFIVRGYDSKRERNPKYSIRAYAKFLGIDHSLLTKFLKGEQELSPRSKLKCLEKLGACQEEILKLKRKQKGLFFEEITDEEFEIISNWVHFAILELMTLPKFKLTDRGVSRRLGITVKEAGECIQRLVDRKYIEVDGESYRILKVNNTFYPDARTNKAKIDYQIDLLRKSENALNNVPLEERDHASVFVAISKDEMPQFKTWMKEARRQLVEMFQKKKDFDEVYCLQVSFFPLTTKE